MKRELRAYVITDVHSPDAFEMPKLDPKIYDVVLTLGDIDKATLDYIAHMSQTIPKYGVPGGHDKIRPLGVMDLHGKVVTVKGIRIGGLGGSPKYKDKSFHYSERQIANRMLKMPPVDVLITHTPPLATSMNEGPVHRGFKAYDRYIMRYSPCYMLHGHLERNSMTKVHQTTVIGIACMRPLTLTFDKQCYPPDDFEPRRASFFSPRFWIRKYLRSRGDDTSKTSSLELKNARHVFSGKHSILYHPRIATPLLTRGKI